MQFNLGVKDSVYLELQIDSKSIFKKKLQKISARSLLRKLRIIIVINFIYIHFHLQIPTIHILKMALMGLGNGDYYGMDLNI